MMLPENQPAIWRAFLRLLFLQNFYKYKVSDFIFHNSLFDFLFRFSFL